jgi:hypothetical protein
MDRSGKSPADTVSRGWRNWRERDSAETGRRGPTAADRNGRGESRTGCLACAPGCTPRERLAQRPRSGASTWGRPLASVLTAAAALGAASTRDTVFRYPGTGDAVTVLEMSALRAAAELSQGGARGEAGFGDLAADCAARRRARLARPQRAPGGWSVELPAGTCVWELCGSLPIPGRQDPAHRRMAARQGPQAARPLPDRRRRTARRQRTAAPPGATGMTPRRPGQTAAGNATGSLRQPGPRSTPDPR